MLFRSWANALRDIFTLKGDTRLDIVEEIQPTFPVQNWEPELYLARAESLMIATATVAAPAGENAKHQIINPAGSGVLAIVEFCVVSANLSWEWMLGYSQTSIPGALNAKRARDWRIQNSLGNPSDIGTLLPRQGAGVGSHSSIVARARAAINDQRVIPGPFVVPPGLGFAVESLTAALTLNSNIYYRERRAESAREL